MPTRESNGVRIAAAGDIACDPGSEFFAEGGAAARRAGSSRRRTRSSRGHYAAVLTLGDTQYEDGAYAKFLASYDPSWGRVKSITKPAPGNHEYQSRQARRATTSTSAARPAILGRATTASTSAAGTWSRSNSNCSCGRRLRSRLAPGAVAAARPRGASGEHARSRTGTTRGSRRARTGATRRTRRSGSAVRRGRRRRPQRARSRLRALRAADAEWRSRPRVAASASSSSARAARRCGRSRRSGRTARHADATSLGVLELTLGAGAYAWRFRASVGSFTDSGQRRCH